MENNIITDEPPPKKNKNLKIVAVIDCEQDEVQSIKLYCESRNINFIARQFTRSKSEDINIIHKLPAFHMYVKTAYIDTFYLDNQPHKHIKEGLDMLKAKEINLEKQKAFWSGLYFKMKKSINGISTKKILTSD